MKTLSLIFWALVALALVTLGLANRDIVRLSALPDPVSQAVGWGGAIELPLFLVILLGVGAGLLLGVIWEWIREMPERAQAKATARELAALRAEVAKLKGEQAREQHGSDLIALVDQPLGASRGLGWQR